MARVDEGEGWSELLLLDCKLTSLGRIGKRRGGRRRGTERGSGPGAY